MKVIILHPPLIKKYLIGLICVLFLSLISSCFYTKVEPYDMFNFKNDHIHRIQNLDSIRADFSIINEFDWDAMVIIGHYTSKDKIKALDLKNTWSIRNEIAAMSSIDFHELILFLKGKNVVRYTKLKGIRFSTANGEPPFPKIISKKELASYYIFNREKSNIYFELIAPKNIN